MTRKDTPRSGLVALLDALEQEVLAAPAEEMRDALREAGRSGDIVCHEVRVLLNEAIAVSEDGFAATLWSETCSGTGLDQPFGVSRELRTGARSHPVAGTILAQSYRRH